MMTGVDMVHVPYCGGSPVVTDMIAGQVQVMFDLPASSLEPIRAGKLRALAMTVRSSGRGFLTCRPSAVAIRANVRAEIRLSIYGGFQTPAGCVWECS
jgi:tripartite-type tricarboxylate transporter receptor subunit TctC